MRNVVWFSSLAVVLALSAFGCKKTADASADSGAGSGNSSDDNSDARTHLKHLAVSLAMYTSDFDDRMPMKENWAVGTKPYVKVAENYRSPHHPNAAVGFAYNAALSTIQTSTLANPSAVVELFETTLNSPNPSDNGESWWMPTGGAENQTAFADSREIGLDKKPDPSAFQLEVSKR